MQIFEDMPSIKISATSVSLNYNIIEADGLDHDAVKAALLAFVPISNAPPGAVYAWPRRACDITESGPGSFKATVTWATLSYQYATKIGGSQQQVRVDKRLANSYGDVPAKWALGGDGVPIGWDGKTVHGLSIFVPGRSWNESVEIPISQYTFDYEDRVDKLQETPVNSAAFRGKAAGEVLFMGMQAQVSTQNPDFVTAVFDFSYSRNHSVANGNAITVGAIANIEKDGWDYLDVHYEKLVDDGGGKLIPGPDYVLIHRVYDRASFAVLNIGTGRALPLWQV